MLLVMGLGAALRLVALGPVPSGLYQDEAFNGLDALEVLRGERPLYFTANNGREPLYIYLASLSIASLGRTVTAVRLPAALLGTLTIPATAALGNALFNRRTALIASALVAWTFWPLHLSRVAFRAVGLPLFLALALAAGWQGARRHSRAWILAGGLLYGVAFYTYPAVYFTLPVLVLFVLYLYLTGYRKQLRGAAPWFVFGAVVSLTPLLITVAGDPSLLFGRAAQVSVLNPAVTQGNLVSTLVRNVGKGLGMFFWSGDRIPRHNLPGRPVFDPLIALFFVLGTAWGVRNWRRPAAALAISWTFLMLVPTLMAEDAPHFLRGVGVLPVACLLPAVGLDQSWHWLNSKRKLGRRSSAALMSVILIASLGLTVRDYWRYARDPLTGFAFQDAAAELAEEMNAFEGPVWASERFYREWESIPYLVGEKVHWLAEGEEPRLTTQPAALFVWPYEPIEPLLAALPPGVILEGWRGALIKGDLETVAYPLYWGYRLEPSATMSEVLARFQDHISLGRAAVTPSPSTATGSDALQVILTWTAEVRPELDYQVFVHVSDADGIVVQDDSAPADGTLPTTWWRSGDQIVDRHEIRLPTSYDPGLHTIAVGLYCSDERLEVLESVRPVRDDAVVISGLMGN